jgi:hypothetical protein
MTHSEQRFFDYCAARCYTAECISTEPNVRRTADFRVQGSGVATIVEVEELTANEDDLREHEAFKINGSCSGGGIIGSRARRHIRDAADQLKSHRAEALPSVIVLYDNIRFDGARPCFPYADLQSFHIDAAMFGFIQATVTLSGGSTQCSKPDKAGGSRTATKSEKRYVSAVCVLYDLSDLFMVTYHNFFAEHPLPVTMFRGPLDAHFAKPTNPDLCPGVWKKI